jgi:hypothetical protein
VELVDRKTGRLLEPVLVDRATGDPLDPRKTTVKRVRGHGTGRPAQAS